MSAGEPAAFEVRMVESGDGTPIGCRVVGSGPGVVLIHGGGATSYTLERLAGELATRFSVHLPDRRGRGLSATGPPEGDGPHRDVEDVIAVVRAARAKRLFGLSAGAVLALRAALVTSEITKLALFEPPLEFDGVSQTWWVPRYERELSDGRQGAALVTVIKGTEGVSIPRFVLVPLMSLMLRRATAAGHDPSVKALSEVVTGMQRDIRIVRDSAGPLERFTELRCEVLLMGGARSPRPLKAALDGLAAAVPGARRVTVAGTGHRAPTNDGKPRQVAQQLLAFFA